MRPCFIPVAAISFWLLASTVAPAMSEASARQLHGGPFLGGAGGDGNQGGFWGAVGVHGAYGLNDTFRLYGNLQYGLGGGDAANTPRHSTDLSLGIAYSLDVLSVIPWFGAGLQIGLVGTPAVTGVVALPAVELRGGIDYLTSRYFGLTFQVAYAFVYANHDVTGNIVTVTLGLRFATDL